MTGTTHQIVSTVAILLSLWTGVSTRQPHGPTDPPRLPLTLCHTEALPPDALCGSYPVPENRQRPGRSIALRVVVLPARLSTGRDAVLALAGGPGQANSLAIATGAWIEAVRADRAVVLVDQRGTGQSHPLNCDLQIQSHGAQSLFHDLFDVGRIAACRDLLSRSADLGQYDLPQAMDDLDDVRAALGYDQFDVLGWSYGTRSAFVYARRHPERVRIMVLTSVVTPDFLAPLHYARDAQRALDAVVASCSDDPTCRAAYPTFGADVAESLRRAAVGVRAVLRDSASQHADTVVVPPGVFAEDLRALMYQPVVLGQLPWLMHLAAGGDFGPLVARMAQFRAGGGFQLPMGTWFTITCNEDVRFIPADKIDSLTRGTFLGDYRIRQQQAACAQWPQTTREATDTMVFTVNAPTLIISGRLDPVTPPSWGEHALRWFAHGRHVVIPGATHTPRNRCVDRLLAAVIASGSVDEIDRSCVDSVPPLHFMAPP